MSRKRVDYVQGVIFAKASVARGVCHLRNGSIHETVDCGNDSLSEAFMIRSISSIPNGKNNWMSRDFGPVFKSVEGVNDRFPQALVGGKASNIWQGRNGGEIGDDGNIFHCWCDAREAS